VRRGGKNALTKTYSPPFELRIEKGKGFLTLKALEIPGSQVMDFRLLMLKSLYD
jgi:hypothetical protein